MKPHRILAALDFSDLSPVVAREADELARLYSAELTLLHVNPIATTVVMDWTYVVPPEEVARLWSAAEDQLRSIARELSTQQDRVRREVVAGDASHEIIRQSEAFDLVVVGTHGRRGMSRFLLGSVAEKVVRGAHSSVLVVRPKGK